MTTWIESEEFVQYTNDNTDPFALLGTEEMDCDIKADVEFTCAPVTFSNVKNNVLVLGIVIYEFLEAEVSLFCGKFQESVPFSASPFCNLHILSICTVGAEDGGGNVGGNGDVMGEEVGLGTVGEEAVGGLEGVAVGVEVGLILEGLLVDELGGGSRVGEELVGIPIVGELVVGEETLGEFVVGDATVGIVEGGTIGEVVGELEGVTI
jgi:hypothetical protein